MGGSSPVTERVSEDKFPLERVLEITSDILRFTELNDALDSISRGVADLFGFQFVTIVIADGPLDELVRRTMHGYTPEIAAARMAERVSRADILALLLEASEVTPNCYYLPAEKGVKWQSAIYCGGEATTLDRGPEGNAWHDEDGLCLVLRDEAGEMIGYMSPDGPRDGRVPSFERLRIMGLFVNLAGLALAKSRAHRSESERRRLLERNQSRLRHDATHDALTGLPNRVLFRERVSSAMERARSTSCVQAVLFVDLDDFKQINDTLGHAAGDAMLSVVAARLQSALRATDVVARVGGDEFAVLLLDCGSADVVESIVTKIQEALVAPAALDGRIVYTTASVGVALLSNAEERIEDVIRRADAAMYHAKSMGRARHAYFDASMLDEATRRLALSSDMRGALETESFSVDFQPIVRLHDGEIDGFEALARWRNPKTGEVLPAEFIPLAEDVGLIVALGRYVFTQALRSLREWQRIAPTLSLRMHINLSVQELLEPDLVTFVERNLRRFGITPSTIVLEITESLMIRANPALFARLNAIRAMGVRLCIDDFGTGYSSLRYIHELAVDALKIDRSFIAGVDGELATPPIVRMLSQLGEAYGMEVVAEGVETTAQAQALLAQGCRYAQGFHFYRPMQPSSVSALLAVSAMAV